MKELCGLFAAKWGVESQHQACAVLVIWAPKAPQCLEITSLGFWFQTSLCDQWNLCERSFFVLFWVFLGGGHQKRQKGIRIPSLFSSSPSSGSLPSKEKKIFFFSQKTNVSSIHLCKMELAACKQLSLNSLGSGRVSCHKHIHTGYRPPAPRPDLFPAHSVLSNRK